MSPSLTLPEHTRWWGGADGPPTLPAPSSACIRRKAGARAQPTSAQPCQRQQCPHAKVPAEIPPEAAREYMDTTEGLLGPGGTAEGAPSGEWREDGSEPLQGDEGAYLDPGLLSYIDELCSQEDFVTKVEEELDPAFLADLLSPEAQLDLLALVEELEQEEGPSLAQVSWGREVNR
ncbi:hypothetical protein MC885_021147 [Smutsia gigantea]|nr:hypothetical protein MC885_021147 [Smutsia gigantea]